MAINLQKGGDKHSINLTKSTASGQSLLIHANLNWTQEKKKGLFSFLAATQNADLDLGCMYELLDGSKGVIQPLGNSFGSKTSAPYIFLDKDDRDGASADGENMRVFKPELIKRILFFGLLYAGASDFTAVNGRMFFKISNGEQVNLDLDNAGLNKIFCAAALIENKNGTLTISKEARYFNGHADADKYYGFGFTWKTGTKD
jgi:tellurite resistance protein TerA